jgi:tetratricopeptide (TPR) repeat protein
MWWASIAATVWLAQAGCGQLPADALSQLEQADRAYRQRRYDDALRSVDPVIAAHSQTSGIEEAYYLRGMCYARLDRLSTARHDLERAIESPRPDIVSRAHAQMGHIAYIKEDYRSACHHYSAALPGFADEPPKDEIYYRYAECLWRSGDCAAARRVLPKIWRLFPDSRLAPFARRKFTWPHDYSTIQCGAFQRSELAHDLARHLRSQGFDSRVGVELRDDALHRVYVGQYATFMSARSALQHVLAIVPDAVIVP